MPGLLASHHWRYGKRVYVPPVGGAPTGLAAVMAPPPSLSATGTSTASSFADTVLATSPKAYWRMGMSSGNAPDETGNGHTAVASGNPTYGVTGISDSDAITCPGAQATMFEASDHADFDIGTNDFSLMAAIKGITYSTEQQIMGHDGAGNDGEFDWWIDNQPDLIRLTVRDATSGSLAMSFTASTDLTDGSWHLLFLTVDRSSSSGAKLYIDSSTAEDTDDPTSASSYVMTNTRPVRLCAATDLGATQLYGSAGEFAIWNGQALSSGTIAGILAAL